MSRGGNCGTLGGVKIDAETSQADLQRMYDAVLRREFLKSTPLNLKVFLRYAVLFLLFPGMVFGFKVGMLTTLAFCGVLIAVLIFGSDTAAVVAIYSWLSAAVFVILAVNIAVMRRARNERKRRAGYRPATAGLKHAVLAPQQVVLKWHPGERNRLVARLNIRAPRQGVCAMLLTFRHYDGRRIITSGIDGTCILQSGGASGEDFHALILYRLEAGTHELAWAMPGAQHALHAEISQLNVM